MTAIDGLTTTEKVHILKTVDIFAGTPEEALVEVASLLEEVAIRDGEAIFEKGDVGASMYIIVSGQVRVHDGERTLNHLRERDVFGEMALVDSAPRLASVTALEETQLLRLKQGTFYNLMDGQPEVARGIIRVLSRHLRARVQDLDDLRTRLERVILPLGIALSAEKSLDRLLERILAEAKAFCNADASFLYLRADDDLLIFTVARADSLDIAMGGTTGREMTLPPVRLYDAVTAEPNNHDVAARVALRGYSINLPDVYHVEGFDLSAIRDFDEEYGYRCVSNLTIPMKNHLGEVIAVLQLFNAQDPETGEVIPFDPYHQLVVESLASQAAVALNTQMLLRRQEELLKLEHDLKIGRQVQSEFLPQELPQPPGWEIAARFQPAREVAGDFYDVMKLAGDRLGLVIGDVVGKGVGAALLMAFTRGLARVVTRQSRPVDGDLTSFFDAVKLINDYIANDHAGHMFVTLFFGVLDPQTGLLTYVNGGHNPPVVLSSTGTVKAQLTRTGMALGLFGGMDFEIRAVTLEIGDTLIAYTDGVTEAENANGEFFSEEGLLSLLSEPSSSASALLERIETSLHAHIGDTEQSDDITMLAVRRVPVDG
jgi:sigma-B regulation protein RsbU (phosphoserine phosphatase)